MQEESKTSHKLHTPWTFWHYNREDKSLSFDQSLKPFSTVTSLEEFFHTYAYLKPPSEMPRTLSVSLFRSDQKPMWEASPQGGTCIVKIRKADNLNLMWEKLLLSLVGEAFDSLTVIGA